MSQRRRMERARWKEFEGMVKRLEPAEQNLLMHFPGMDRSSEEAFDRSLRCDRCVDKAARVCSGRGLQGYMEVMRCMDEKDREPVRFLGVL